MDSLAMITVGIDPTPETGPFTLAWHGIMSAVGIAVGALLASYYARERGLDTDVIPGAVIVMALAGIVGARFLFLVESGDIARPGEWLGTHGFSIYGGVLFGALAAAVYLHRLGHGIRHLDALAVGFPLGLAVGRIGDVINGEHFGPPTDRPWGIRWTHPDTEAPSTAVAYHSGGLYEVVVGLALLALVWPLRHRLAHPATLLWLVLGLYAAGRFAVFFYRDDSDGAALGLVEAQWTSVALMVASVVALVGLVVTRGRRVRT